MHCVESKILVRWPIFAPKMKSAPSTDEEGLDRSSFCAKISIYMGRCSSKPRTPATLRVAEKSLRPIIPPKRPGGEGDAHYRQCAGRTRGAARTYSTSGDKKLKQEGSRS